MAPRLRARRIDPLGLFSSVTVRAKLLVQDIWKKKFDWDTPLSVDIINIWAGLSNDLNSISQTKFQRPYFLNTETTSIAADIDLHVFVDASACAYGAVAYLNVKCSNVQENYMLVRQSNSVKLA
jgi:hypothetical protein